MEEPTPEKIKKIFEAEKLKKEEDIIRREKMFHQVLEIDADDTVALYGIGDIAFHRENFKEAVLLWRDSFSFLFFKLKLIHGNFS